MKKHLSRLLSALLSAAVLAAPAAALTVDQALELLEDHYYYDIPDEAYRAGSLDELFTMLGDPYTQYMTKEQYAAFLSAVEDTVDMVGIGVSIELTDEGILVLSPLEGSSAQQAGLLPGDLIIAVDGTPCVPAGKQHQELMLGQEGTQVTVTVLRDGTARDYVLTRRAVYIPNTQFTLLEDGVGYVDCNSFGKDTGQLLASGLKQYDSQVGFWILDLRDNGGGYVDSAADVLSWLAGPGYYVYYEEKDGQVGIYARSESAVSKKPVIVLTNGSSASASEATAAGIRDTGRGITVGSRTYGKGVGQIVLDGDSDPQYFDGDALKITTGRFYSAGGTTTDRIGVIPTLLVSDWDAGPVALALTGGSVETSSLCVLPGTVPFYVNPDADDATLSALLAAIPPQITLFYNDGVFSPCTPAQAAAKLGLDYDDRWFNDVSDSFYAYAINTLSTYGLLGGTGGGSFTPKGQLTRAQLCVMLARVFNTAYSGPSRFSDVPQDSWYGPSVNAIAELGLMTGVGGGRFDPGSPVTQEQFLTALGRAARCLHLGLDNYGQSVEATLSTLPLGMQPDDLAPYADWAKSSVAVLAWGRKEVLNSSRTFLYTTLDSINPSAPVLREEAAAGIYALLSGLEILP